MCETERSHFFRPWNCSTEEEEDDDDEEEEDEEEEEDGGDGGGGDDGDGDGDDGAAVGGKGPVPSPFTSAATTTTIIAERSDTGRKMKVEHEEEDDAESVISSSCSTRNYSSENDSVVSRRSCSVSSEEMGTGSLNMLSNFVLGSHDKHQSNERRSSKSILSRGGGDECYGSAASLAEWSNVKPASLYYPSSIYECSAYQSHWPLQSMYINGAGGFAADYAWLPANYQSVQEAVNRLSHQDAVAKQMKKLRPKKFRCHYCNVAFSNNGQLKGHLRIHTGERPFKCDADGCGKSFTRNEELTRHKRIHTGLRPYSCLICRKGFGRKDHLKKHTKTHDNRNVYQLAAAAAAAAAASTPFPAFHFAHHPSMSMAGIPYAYPL